MDAVTNPAELVSRNGLVLVRPRVPKGTRSVPMSDRAVVVQKDGGEKDNLDLVAHLNDVFVQIGCVIA